MLNILNSTIEVQKFLAKAEAKYPVLASRVSRFLPMFKDLMSQGIEQRGIEGTLKLISKIFPKEPNFIWAVKSYRGWLKDRSGIKNQETQKQAADWEFIRTHQSNFRHFALNAKEHNYRSVLDCVIKPNMSAKDFHKHLQSLEEAELLKKSDVGEHRVVEPDLDTQETFLKLPGGWEWVLLDRGYCSEERDAMEHCGNAGYVEDDRILSLREPMKNGKQKPHLTFILNQGVLGEMKGYKNSKPAKKFHKEIVELLKDPRIKSIKGGGYKPENNFQLRDLSESEQKEILTMKPELDFKTFIKKPENAEKYLGKEIEGDSVILEEFKNIFEFAKLRSKELKQFLDWIEDTKIYGTSDLHSVLKFFDEVASDKRFSRVIKKINDADLEEYANNLDYDIEEVKKQFTDDPAQLIHDMLKNGLLESLAERLGFATDDALKQAYEDDGWRQVKDYFFEQYGKIYFIMSDPWIDNEVKLATSIDDFDYQERYDEDIPRFKPDTRTDPSWEIEHALDFFYDHHNDEW